MNKKGFTLSEVLITLTVISLVSAMTIPSFIKNYHKRVYAARIKKAYSQLEYAVHNAMTDEQTQNFYQTKSGGKICDEDGENCKYNPAYFYDNYFKIFKRDCRSECLALSYSTPDGSYSEPHDGTTFAYCTQTVDGFVFCGQAGSITTVDTNGPDGPNVMGYDMFLFVINEDGTIRDYDEDPDHCLKNYKGAVSGGCLAKVIQDGWSINY